MCESLAGKLECGVYHSKAEGKEEMLTSWIGGSDKVIVATGALGTGGDIEGITWSILVDVPYGMIAFGQEFGGGGRRGERVKSLILLRRSEYERLECAVEGNMMVDERCMREFIVTSGCRNLVKSKFLDGEKGAVECEELGGELCDGCIGDTMVDVLEEEIRTWSVKRDARKECRGIEWMMKVLKELGEKCGVCWVMGGLEDCGHTGRTCVRLEKLSGMRFDEARKKVRYKEHSCCFGCSVPVDWCSEY